jgi:hypothetical protein
VLDARSSQVTQKLRHVLVKERPDCFQLNDKLPLDEEISEEFSEQGAVFVEDGQWMLLDRENCLPLKAMNQPVFINFLRMTVTEMAMQREAGFADLVAQLKYRFLHVGFLFAPFASFCG